MPDQGPDQRKEVTRRFRRLGPRLATHAQAFRDPAGAGPDIAVRLLDLSVGGVRLLLSEKLLAGHAMGLILHGPRVPPLACVVRVAWSAEGEAGGFVTGAEFSRPAGEDIIAALGQG